MKTMTWMMGLSLLAAACSGTQSRDLQTQDEMLEEQMRLADEQAANSAQHDSQFAEAESDAEKSEKFDEEEAEHELKRASLNAVDCPNTFEKAQLVGYKPGTVTVTVTFANDGSVKEAKVDAAYADSNVGNCIVRAIEPTQVKPYVGPEKTLERKLELLEAKPTDAPKKAEPKKAAPKKAEPKKAAPEEE